MQLRWPIAMFNVWRPATWHRRQTLDRLELAIQLVEDHVARTVALSARLTTAGHANAATYASASLELGRLYLDLLYQGRFRLLTCKRPRVENCAAIKASLFDSLASRARWDSIEPAQQHCKEPAAIAIGNRFRSRAIVHELTRPG